MSKKTWSTILVVVLVVAAAVGIYFATKPAPEVPAPEATETVLPVETEVPATEEPTEVPATEEPTEAPTEEPVTEAPAAEASEAPVVAAALETATQAAEEVVEEVKEAAEDVAAQAEEKLEVAVAAVEEKAEEVKETAEAVVAAAEEKAEEVKETAEEVVAAVEEKAEEVVASAQATDKTATASAQGFAGPVAVTITLNDDNTIASLVIGDDDFKETEGLGARAREEEFTNSFLGKLVPLSDSDVDVLSGASITRKAVIEAINLAAEDLGITAEEIPATAEAVTEVVAEEVPEAVEEAAVAVEQAAEETAAEVLPAADKAKASIWHTFTKDQEAYLVKAAADFNASQDKYEIEVLAQPYDGFLGAVNSAVIAGVGPDIIFNYASEAASYVKGGYLADLGQFIYDEEIGIEGFEGSLVDGVMNGEVKAFEDGGIHYLPAYTTGPILFYNKTLFDELQIAPPTTWEEMEAAAKTIFEQKGIAALGCDSLTDLVQMFIMETEGAGYIDVENKVVLFDTPEVRAKIEWLVDMVKKGYFLVKSTGNYFSEDFNAGIVASYIGSSAGYPYITPADGSFEFAMAPVPAATWYPSWNRGPIVFYYKDDARAEAAYQFVKYFISADVNAGWVEAVTALAPYSWTKETDAYKAYAAQDTLAAQALNAVATNLNVAGSLPAVEGANTVRDALKDAIIKAAHDNKTVDEVWTEAVTISNSALQGK